MSAALRTEVLNAIDKRLGQLEVTGVLTTSAAYELAYDIARNSISAEEADLLDPVKTLSAVNKLLNPFFSEVRELVAGQLIGMSFEDVISIIENSMEVVFNNRNLVIVPLPTLAFTGYCQPHDPWNLFCNAGEIEQAAALKPGTEKLRRDLALAKQMLHFIMNKEIDLEDVKAAKFTGVLKQPQLSLGALA